MSFSLALIASAALASTPSWASSIAPAQTSSPARVSSPDARVSSERVAEVVIDGMICQAFGYSPDWEGLSNWTEKQVDALAAQTSGLDREGAVRRLNRRATSRYWFVRNRYDGALALVDQTGFYNTRRFISRFRDRCGELDGSVDAGKLISRTGEEPDTLELMASVRAVMFNEETLKTFKRAYPPYLGEAIGNP